MTAKEAEFMILITERKIDWGIGGGEVSKGRCRERVWLVRVENSAMKQSSRVVEKLSLWKLCEVLVEGVEAYLRAGVFIGALLW